MICLAISVVLTTNCNRCEARLEGFGQSGEHGSQTMGLRSDNEPGCSIDLNVGRREEKPISNPPHASQMAGKRSPGGLTEALGEVLKAGGATPALEDTPQLKGQRRRLPHSIVPTPKESSIPSTPRDLSPLGGQSSRGVSKSPVGTLNDEAGITHESEAKQGKHDDIGDSVATELQKESKAEGEQKYHPGRLPDKEKTQGSILDKGSDAIGNELQSESSPVPQYSEALPTTHSSRYPTPVTSEPVQDEGDVVSYWAIWVGGITQEIHELDLSQLFQPYAKNNILLSVYIRRVRQGNLGVDDLGFVNFYNEQDAFRAYEELKDKATLKGKKLKLRVPKKKSCRMEQLEAYRQQTIELIDRRPNPNIPVTTKSVHAPPSHISGSNRGRQSGRESALAQHFNRALSMSSIRQTSQEKLQMQTASPLNFNVPWISTPEMLEPYFVDGLTRVSAPIPTIRKYRNDGYQLFMALQRGLTSDPAVPKKKIPFLSFKGCPGWVPTIALKNAVQQLESTGYRDEDGKIKLLLVLGPPTRGDYSLDLGVLQAIEGIKNQLATPATPLLPRYILKYWQMERENTPYPPMRPSSYLLCVTPLSDM